MFIKTFLEMFCAPLICTGNHAKLVAIFFSYMADKVDTGREHFFTKTVGRQSKRLKTTIY